MRWKKISWDLFESQVGEKIVDEGEEEGFVLVYEFWEVHVAQDSHHDRRLGVLRVVTLRRAQRSQHGEDIPQTEVVVNLELRVWEKKRWKHIFVVSKKVTHFEIRDAHGCSNFRQNICFLDKMSKGCTTYFVLIAFFYQVF